MDQNQFVKNKVDQVNVQGYGLHLEGILSQAWAIFKKTFLSLSVVSLVYMLTMVVIWSLMFESLYGYSFAEIIQMAQDNPEALESSMGNFTLTSSLIYSLVFGLGTALVAPILAGIFQVCYRQKYEGGSSSSDLFVFYKTPYFGNILIYSFLLSFVLQMLNFLMSEWVPTMGGMLGTFLQVLIQVSLVFTIPLIVFGKMGWIEAMQSSIKITTKNWFFLFFVLAIGLILSMLGILLCGIGVMFTYPFFYVVVFAIYDEVIGFNQSNDPIAEIGEN
ncbi:MAG TPA: hypothetical protein VL022_01140 [Moheibacter sp.]|nr:hypothetical protein [Moheibacter sp.]